MRSLTFEQIDPGELDAFSARHPQGNFQQTSGMGRLRAGLGSDVRYFGVREDGELVAATVLEIHRSRMSTFAQVHDGPLVDLHDDELVRFLFSNLARTAKEAGAAQLEITPETPFRIRDTNGAPLPDPSSGEPMPKGVPAGAGCNEDTASFEALVGAGFTHGGFTTGYTAVPRWRYVKDLTGIDDEEALLATYSKTTKRHVKTAHASYVSVERIGRDDLPLFHQICELSCEKQGFENRPLSYYQAMFDALGESAEFLVAYIDMPAYLAAWEQKRDALQADAQKYESVLAGSDGESRAAKKARRQLEDTQNKLGSVLRGIETARTAIEGGAARVPASCALFAWHEREAAYLFSGSDQRYASFCAPAAIQHHVMLECLERGVTRHNFYGIDGIFDDPDNPGNGVLEFKQGFCGYVEELMGEFTLVLRPLAYATKRLAHKVLGR